MTNFCRNRRLDADPAYLAIDEGGADNEDNVGPFDCPEGLTNITTLIKRSGPLCSKDCLISGFERAKDLRIFYALLRSLL